MISEFVDNFDIEIYYDDLTENENETAHQLLENLYTKKSWIIDSKRKV